MEYGLVCVLVLAVRCNFLSLSEFFACPTVRKALQAAIAPTALVSTECYGFRAMYVGCIGLLIDLAYSCGLYAVWAVVFSCRQRP